MTCRRLFGVWELANGSGLEGGELTLMQCGRATCVVAVIVSAVVVSSVRMVGSLLLDLLVLVIG